MHRRYAVHIVAEDAMPEGHDFVLIEDEGGDLALFYREGATASARVLEESWAAYRTLTGDRPRLRSAS